MSNFYLRMFVFIGRKKVLMKLKRFSLIPFWGKVFPEAFTRFIYGPSFPCHNTCGVRWSIWFSISFTFSDGDRDDDYDTSRIIKITQRIINNAIRFHAFRLQLFALFPLPTWQHEKLFIPSFLFPSFSSAECKPINFLRIHSHKYSLLLIHGRNSAQMIHGYTCVNHNTIIYICQILSLLHVVCAYASSNISLEIYCLRKHEASIGTKLYENDFPRRSITIERIRFSSTTFPWQWRAFLCLIRCQLSFDV